MSEVIKELENRIGSIMIEIDNVFVKREKFDSQLELLRKIKGDMKGRVSELKSLEEKANKAV